MTSMSDEARIRRRNYLALSAEGSLFFAGLAFIDANAVVPVFIFTYIQSLKLASLATALTLVAMILAQILVGPYIRRIRNMPAYIARILFIFRPLPVLMIPLLFSKLAPAGKVTVFLVIYFLLFLGQGLVSIAWNDLFGRTIDTADRGRVYGNQQLIGGLGGILAGVLIKILLNSQRLSDDQRYAIVFGCASLLLIISAFVMLKTRDFPHPVETSPVDNWHFYRHLPRHLHLDANFRRLTVIRVLTTISGMIAPLLVLFGRTDYQLHADHISTLMSIQIAGGLVGGFLWRAVSVRFGHKSVIWLAQINGLFIGGLALVSWLLRGQAPFWLLLIPLVLVSGINVSNWVGFVNYTIDIASEENRTSYLLIGSIINFPLAILTFLTGVIADRFGFLPLFIIISLTAGAGLLLSRGLQTNRT